MKFILTTPQSTSTVSQDMTDFIRASQLEYVPREKLSIPKLLTEHQAEGVVVWEKQGPILYIGDAKFYFHPSMGKCRISAYRKEGQADSLIKACDLNRGDSFLDCTLGMGADSVVASYFSETGKITGLESQAVVAQVISWGMKLYGGNMPWLNQAINRVEVINIDHQTYLRQQEDQSYDLVYFDPMFTRPLLRSQPISSLRKLANHNSLDQISVQEACRVARKRVVFKTLQSSEEIERLGFRKLVGSKNNPIAYGVIIVN
jgi:16S rRNA (guanine1516-N2)-methyltransferase